MRRAAMSALCGVLALWVIGCGSGRTVTGLTSGVTTPPPQGASGGTVDFATQIQPILDNNCAFSGCHAQDTGSGGLVLDAGKSYGNLVNVASSEVAPDKRVLPKNSNGSYLIEKLTQRQPRSGGQMPLGGSPLDASDIKLIQTWIDEGALAKKP